MLKHRASTGQQLHSGNARHPPILSCVRSSVHRLSVMCKTHNVYCSRRKAVQEQNGGSISGTGFAIEDFQPFHIKDRTSPFEQVADAYRYLESNQQVDTLVITL